MEILTLGEKIRRKRKSLRLTLKDVAGNSVTPAQLSYVESDKCKPSKSLLKYICDKIGLDIEYAMETESDQAQKYCDYFMREYEFYLRRGELSEARVKLEEIERLSSEYGLDKYMGIVCYKKGIDAMESNDQCTAEYYLYAAMELFMKLDEGLYIARCYYNLGLIALARSYFDDAVIYLNNALETALHYNESDKHFIANILICKARAFYRLKNSVSCDECLTEAVNQVLEVEENKRDADMVCEAALMISTMEEADKYVREAENIYKTSGQEIKTEYLNTVKLLLAIKFNRYSELSCCISGLAAERERELDYKSAVNILEAVKKLIESGNYDYAEALLGAVGKNENREIMGMYKYLKSKLLQRNDIENSVNHFHSSLEQLGLTGNSDIRMDITCSLGSIYKNKKNYAEALNYLIMCAKLYSRESLTFTGIQ